VENSTCQLRKVDLPFSIPFQTDGSLPGLSS
jgi:hypothetical protein